MDGRVHDSLAVLVGRGAYAFRLLHVDVQRLELVDEADVQLRHELRGAGRRLALVAEEVVDAARQTGAAAAGALVGPGARVTVVARRPVGQGRVRAESGRGVARARVVA